MTVIQGESHENDDDDFALALSLSPAARAVTPEQVAVLNAVTLADGGVILANPSVRLGTDLDVTQRQDGTLQVTYKGRPVYLYVGDAKPGDINGDGIGRVWHLIDLK